MLKVEGLNELKKAFEKMPDELMNELESAVNDAGEVVKRNVEKHAPGNLKNGIEMKKATKKGGYISGQLKLKRGFAYGVPVELGHRLFAWGRRTSNLS